MIYLDYAATTPVDPRVLEGMLPFFREQFGNPSSVHQYGQAADGVLSTARETVASILNCQPDEIIFTSCGSESDNLALRGAAIARRSETGADKILLSRVEHPAVTRTAIQLERTFGFKLGWLEVDEFGMISPEAVSKAVGDDIALVSVMYANNEIGTINPIHDISRVCRERGILFHTDAVQAAAYLPIDVNELGVDLMSLGAHKFYGPKGVGALFVRKNTNLIPSITGGGQEFGLRSGTQNVPYIIGFAQALKLATSERTGRIAHVKPLRDQIIGTVLETIQDGRLTGHARERLPNHASFVLKDVDGNLLLTLLDSAGYACSSGSACKTGNPEPSEVMEALKMERTWGLGSLRITLGMDTQASQVKQFLDDLPPVVEKARRLKSG
jgi:cysteine desulfurase